MLMRIWCTHFIGLEKSGKLKEYSTQNKHFLFYDFYAIIKPKQTKEGVLSYGNMGCLF